MDFLTVSGTPGSLAAITEFVTDVAEAADLEQDASYRLLLAVDEITTNIIDHGYGRVGKTGELELRVAIDEQTLTIYIEDTGQTYNPSQYERPTDLGLPLEQRRIGGLGVFLAMQSVDQFLYERVGSRNRHTLVVNR